jgi:integrase
MGKRTHEPGKLAAITLKKLVDGWHADGGNLYLFVRGASRTWVFRYTAPDGKRRNMGLGSIDSISLSRARELAREYRAQVKDKQKPIDPIAIEQEAKAQRRADDRKRVTFKWCTDEYLKAHRDEWKNPKHAQQWENTLITYAYPVFGDLPVQTIDTDLIVKCLSPIWSEKTETATRVRGRIQSVLDWATARKFRHGENPARWRGHLDNLLATPSKIQKIEHHAALPFAEIGGFMKDLRTKQGMGARALEFAILTAARSGEVRGATWSEIDFQTKTWTIPPERMKMKKEHRVPLVDAAITLLEELPKLEGGELVFPGSRVGSQLSDMTLTAALKRMGRVDLTAHGFRSTFRDWAAESTNYPRDVAEMALAHAIGDSVEAA